MNGRVVKGQTLEASVSPVSSPRIGRTPTGRTVGERTVGGRSDSAGGTPETPFGVALIDRRGNLLGAGTAAGLAGEVGVPPGVDLRKEDLSSYLDRGLDSGAGRRFPLVSATWVQVKNKRVRVGIYMETGERLVNPERLDLDLGRIAAILSNQGVA